MGFKAKTFTVSLVAGQPVQVFAAGNFLRCQSGDTVQVELGMRDSMSDGQFPMAAGASVKGQAFEVVRLTSDTTQSVTFLACWGEYSDDSLIIGANVVVNTKPSSLAMGGHAGVTATAGATVALVAANASRRIVSIYNEGPEAVYVRADNTTAKSAFPIAVGGVLPLECQQALYVYNPGGVDSTLYIGELG